MVGYMLTAADDKHVEIISRFGLLIHIRIADRVL